MNRLLFVLKHREASWGEGSGGSQLSSGLRNSVRFVVDMLNSIGITSKWVECLDNNYIYREINSFQPTHVILEAFWVVPTKLDVLQPMYPKIKWLVRNHSEMPFLSNEGISMGWIHGYLQRGVEVTCNVPRSVQDMKIVADAYNFSPKSITYTPNFYPVTSAAAKEPAHPHPPVPGDQPTTVKIGCFGAIRPLKNQLMQALAAIRFGAVVRKSIEFHMNATRIEGGGNPILNNLRALFDSTPSATLVEHDWMEHDEFMLLLREMDLNLQVSFSETFNIVTADAVEAGIPVVVSKEVPWIGSYAIADANSIDNMVAKLTEAYTGNRYERVVQQIRDLEAYGVGSMQVWWSKFGAGRTGEAMQFGFRHP